MSGKNQREIWSSLVISGGVAAAAPATTRQE
jgi:hypothetical protein